jgi:hypothetical protein
MKSKKNLITTLIVIIISILIVKTCSNSGDTTIKTQSQVEEWYLGGTLHQASVYEWKNATEKNKLATCADFVASVKKTKNESYNGDLVSMKKDATQMMNCINEAVLGNEAESANLKINEIAATCAILMDM